MHHIDDAFDRGAPIRLKESVILLARGEHIAVLDSASLAPALRLPAQASDYLHQLRVGIARDADASLLRLAERLRRYGLIEGAEMDHEVARTVSHGKIYLVNPDSLARTCANLVRKIPVARLKVIFSVLLVFATVVVALQIWRWISQGQLLQFSLPGLIAYFAVGVPLHEFSHAAACRYTGASVSGMGIQFGSRSFPTPFINTRNLILVRSNRLRTAVCLAGPFFDLLLAAVASLLSGAWFSPFFSTVCACAVFFLAMNLNPFRPSDGRNALEEFRTDGDGRIHPMSSGKRRALSGGYVLFFIVVLLVFVVRLTGVLLACLSVH